MTAATARVFGTTRTPAGTTNSSTASNADSASAAVRPASSDPVRRRLRMAPEVAAINRNAAEPEAEVRQIAREAAWAMVGVLGVPNGPAPTAHVFRAIAESSVRLDMVTRRASTFGPNCFDLLFALPAADVDKTVHTLGWERDTIEFAALRREDRMGKVSMTGSGLRKQPSFVASFFAVLSSAGVAVELSSVSDSCISVVCDSMATGTAVDALRFVYRPQPMSGRP